MTSFSVVIATRNRATLLADTLATLRAQDWPRDRVEIIVADNGSTDETPTVVAEAMKRDGPSLRYLLVTRPGKSAAVNAAVANATGSVIAYTDDDVRPEPQWLARLAAAFEDTGIDFVAGRILPIWEVPPPPWLSPALFGVLAIPENGDRRVVIDRHTEAPIMTIGANMAVRRSVVERIGGLRDDLGKLAGTLRGGEDHEYFLRMLHAGCRGVYEPSAVVHHWVPASRLTRRYFRDWMYRNGRDVSRLEPSFPTSTVRLLGVPRYLWRQAAADGIALAKATLNRSPSRRFYAASRLLWFAGFMRESWFAPRPVDLIDSAAALRTP